MIGVDRHDLHHADGRRLILYGRRDGDLADGVAEFVERPALQQRFDVLTGSWVAISPARNTRPHSELDAVQSTKPGCPLCPGGPEVPFGYDAAVFDNRWPSFVPDPPAVTDDPRLAPSLGRCEVVLYSEAHEGSVATLHPDELARLIAIWRDRSDELWADPAHRHVMIFENRGAAVGATISHPHGQIYAFDRVPPFTANRVAVARDHRARTGQCLACSIIAADEAAPERAAADGTHLMVTVPFAARWPYEVHIRARRHGLRRLTDLEPAEQVELAATIREVVLRYDGLFGFEMPYMMVIHEAPADAPDWHLAVEFLPPQRTRHLNKIRASVETASGLFINDTLPEASAARLRAVSIDRPTEQAVPTQVTRARTGAR